MTGKVPTDSVSEAPAAPTCLHLDRACTSWQACAERTAKHSAVRVTDSIEQFAAASTLGEQLAKAEARVSYLRARFGARPEETFAAFADRLAELRPSDAKAFDGKSPAEWWLDQSEMEEALTVHKWPEAIAALTQLLASTRTNDAPPEVEPPRMADALAFRGKLQCILGLEGRPVTDDALLNAVRGLRTDYPKADIIRLAKAVLAAHGALNIDMGDGEPTYQCCNSVSGHGGSGCLIGETLQVARKLTRLTTEDLAAMNAARARGGIQPPIVDDLPCDCDDGTDPDEPSDRGFVCEHSPDAYVTDLRPDSPCAPEVRP